MMFNALTLQVVLIIVTTVAWSTTATGSDEIFTALPAIYSQRAQVRYVDFTRTDVKVPEVVGIVVELPNLRALAVAGPGFTDRELTEFCRNKSLRFLLLDSTDITDKAIEEVQRVKPELSVVTSEQWAIANLTRVYPGFGDASHMSPDSDHEIWNLLKIEPKPPIERVAIQFRDDREPFSRVLSDELAPIRMFKKLKSLDLSFTQINDGGIYYLRNMRQLEDLTLPLEHTSHVGLQFLPMMEKLQAFSGDPDDEELSVLARKMPNLQNMGIRGDGLTDVGFAHVKKLNYLRSLGISADGLTDEGLAHLAGLQDLQSLSVTSSGIRGPGLRAMESLKKLERLSINCSNLSSLQDLPVLPSLISLDLSNCPIGNLEVAAICRNRGLKSLNIRGTMVDDEGLRALKNLPQLGWIDAKNSRVTEGAAAEFHRILESRKERSGSEGSN